MAKNNKKTPKTQACAYYLGYYYLDGLKSHLMYHSMVSNGKWKNSDQMHPKFTFLSTVKVKTNLI